MKCGRYYEVVYVVGTVLGSRRRAAGSRQQQAEVGNTRQQAVQEIVHQRSSQ